MDAADANDARLADALEYLDLDNVPLADRGPLGGKLAAKLEAVLRKLPIDLSAVPDDWNAPPQVLGEAQGMRVEILRQRDGCWRFSEATVAHIPEMFDKLAGSPARAGTRLAPGQCPRHDHHVSDLRRPRRLHGGRPVPQPERDPRAAPARNWGRSWRSS